MFVYGVIVYAQKKLHRYWPWKTVSSHFHMLVRPMVLHRMALVSVRLFCKNLGKLQEFFLANGLPPPLHGKKLPVRLCKTRKRSTLDRKRSTQKLDTGLSFINTRPMLIQQESWGIKHDNKSNAVQIYSSCKCISAAAWEARWEAMFWTWSENRERPNNF